MGVASTIAVSGMGVAALRLDIAASNIANSLSDGPLADAENARNFPPAYAPLRVDQFELASGGTTGTVSKVSPAAVPAFDPGAPFADANGQVATPNADLASEIVQVMIARFTYAANAKVVHADAQMTATLFSIVA